MTVSTWEKDGGVNKISIQGKAWLGRCVLVFCCSTSAPTVHVEDDDLFFFNNEPAYVAAASYLTRMLSIAICSDYGLNIVADTINHCDVVLIPPPP